MSHSQHYIMSNCSLGHTKSPYQARVRTFMFGLDKQIPSVKTWQFGLSYKCIDDFQIYIRKLDQNLQLP